jgi:hypothetical protein
MVECVNTPEQPMQVDISVKLAVKYNKLSLNSSVNATCFGLVRHHQAIKYII